MNPQLRDLADPAATPDGDPEEPSYMQAIPDSGLGVQAVALLDMELRTAMASLVALTAIPSAVGRRKGRFLRQALDFYVGLDRQPEVLFPAPPTRVPIQTRRLGRLPWAPSVADVELLSFKSPYRVKYPEISEAYNARSRNSTARAMHWVHDGGPRPTIIVVHGFTGSPYWFNSSFFSLPWFYGHGCDVVLVTLPFHGRRNDRLAPFNGSGIFSGGIATFTEAIFQSITDLRVIVGYLQDSGVDNIGITGLSLGGYLTALMAEVEPRLHVAIPNAAVTDLASVIDGWFPAGQLLRAGLRQARIGLDEYAELMSVHSPLRYPALLPTDRLFIIGGLADRLAPPEQSARLWEHWERPQLHWFPGSHILHVGRDRYLRKMGRFLRDTGFSPG